MLSSPFCTPPFSLAGGALFCGKGGHFARCTHMLQGAGGRRAFGTGQVPSPACGAPPTPSPRQREITKKLPNSRNPYSRLKPQSRPDGGFVFQGRVRGGSVKGLCLWAVPVARGTWDRVPGPAPRTRTPCILTGLV